MVPKSIKNRFPVVLRSDLCFRSVLPKQCVVFELFCVIRVSIKCVESYVFFLIGLNFSLVIKNILLNLLKIFLFLYNLKEVRGLFIFFYLVALCCNSDIKQVFQRVIMGTFLPQYFYSILFHKIVRFLHEMLFVNRFYYRSTPHMVM